MSPELKEAVAFIQSEDGLYCMTHPERPGEVVPLFINAGKIYSMQVDAELDPTRFNEGATFTGPVFRFPK
jgi:hypothetical protein